MIGHALQLKGKCNEKVELDFKDKNFIPLELPSRGRVKSGFQTLKKEKSHSFFFPADVDDSLKKDYKNRSNYSSYQYAFPLQQRVMKDKGMSESKRSFEYEYVTDLFFTSKYTWIHGWNSLHSKGETAFHEGNDSSFSQLFNCQEDTP